MRRGTRIRLTAGLITATALLAALLWMLTPRYAPGPLPRNAPRLPPPETTGAGGPSIRDPREARLPFSPDSVASKTLSPAVRRGQPADSSGFAMSPTPGIPFTPADLDTLRLMIPVAGIGPDDLADTYDDARSDERSHHAIDIMAAHGAPVLAAADGRILRLFTSEPGGITIYQLSADGRRVYYYAHLDRYAEGIAEGDAVRTGDVIAYVGDTGNAGAGNYHLHFAVWMVTEPSRYWDGLTINPYPVLMRSAGKTPAPGVGQHR